jgi:phospholipid transport system transporter-binding protein
MFSTPTSITVANAHAALQGGLAAIAQGTTQFDFAPLVVADSAAVATMLAWQRAARRNKLHVEFVNVPSNLQSLMQMYDVAELLTQPA